MTIRRQIAFVAPWLSESALVPVGIGLLTPIVLVASRSMRTLQHRLVALQATVLGMLLLFPFEPFYLSLAVFPTIPLVYLLDGRLSRHLFHVGAVIAALPVTFATIEAWIGLLSASPATSTLLESLARAVFSFVLPPMVGVWCMLAGCVTFQWQQRDESSPEGQGIRIS